MKRVAESLTKRGKPTLFHIMCGQCVWVCIGELYQDVQEDYFSFNKIPRILFIHKLRCTTSC